MRLHFSDKIYFLLVKSAKYIFHYVVYKYCVLKKLIALEFELLWRTFITINTVKSIY